MSKPPVAAVIPNFNMGASLAELLPQILQQGYDKVVVLDDASTDDSASVVKRFQGVEFVKGAVNLGAAGNRNRILGQLSPATIIHFIDADMRLNTGHIPELALQLMEAPDVGFVGGLVYQSDGKQLIFNYGPRQCLRNNLSAAFHMLLTLLGNKLPGWEQWFRRHAKTQRAWPNPHLPPRRRRVLWASEASLLIRAGTFEKLGGYDAALRDHEILELALRLNRGGYKNYFDPAFAATHIAVQVRPGNREISRLRAELYIARKHGFRQWLSWSHRYEPAEQFLP